MKTYDPQKAFNIVWKHFVTDGNPLSYQRDRCYYSGPEGARCAIGALCTKDELRRLVAEGLNCETVHEAQHVLGLSDAPRQTKRFFRALQRAHDSAAFATWGISLSLHDLAIRYNLTIPAQETPHASK